MKLTKKQAEEVAFDDSEEFEIVDDGTWEDGGKYSFRMVVFKNGEGKCFALNLTRSGSYFTDYYYDYELECPEVRSVQRTIQDWELIK